MFNVEKEGNSRHIMEHKGSLDFEKYTVVKIILTSALKKDAECSPKCRYQRTKLNRRRVRKITS